MKKLFLAASISLVLTTTAFAEITNSPEDQKLDYWTNIDEKYANQVVTMTKEEAVAIDNEKYSTKEERYIAGLFFFADTTYMDKRRALNLFELSSKEGFTPATYMTGKLYVSGEAGKRNLYLGQDMLSSIKGDYYYQTKANEALAEMALNDRDYNSAVKYLSRIKSKDSLYRIAKIYEYRGDKETANLVYKEAIGSGFVDAKIEMATRLLQKNTLDTSKAISLLKEVADKGTNSLIVSQAQTLLGDIYFYGNQQMYADHQQGVDWYRKASDNNYPEAMLKLHQVYLENEKNNKYRLGSNKYYIHDLGEKIRKTIDEDIKL